MDRWCVLRDTPLLPTEVFTEGEDDVKDKVLPRW